jgi:hypothetical protein
MSKPYGQGYSWIFWTDMTLTVITAASLLTVITGLPLFRETPLLYSASLAFAAAGLGVMAKDRSMIPLMRKLRLQGRLLSAPVILLLLSMPASVLHILYDLTGMESLKLIAALFITLAALTFLSLLISLSLPSMGALLHLLRSLKGERNNTDNLKWRVLLATAALFALLLLWQAITEADLSGLVLLLPLFSLILIILDIILSTWFRNSLLAGLGRRWLSGEREGDGAYPAHHSEGDSATALLAGESAFTARKSADDTAETLRAAGEAPPVPRSDGFRSVLLFAGHYVDIICGRLDYLAGRADDTYAYEAVRIAGRTFNPGLLPALRTIVSADRFGEKVRGDAEAVAKSIEKYYSDPVRNADMLRLPGISGRSMIARGILSTTRKPPVSEIIKLLSETDPEIRRAGLIAAGKFGFSELREEVLLALSSPDTEREAFHVLQLFGPEVYGSIIGQALRSSNSERESLMIIRLLRMMPLPEVASYMINLIAGGNVSVRLKAAFYLGEQGYAPPAQQKQKIEEIISETVHAVAKIIILKQEAVRRKYFVMAQALRYERDMNIAFVLALVALLTGQEAVALIRSHACNGSAGGTETAAEAVKVAVGGTLHKPLQALLGNHNDRRRLNEISLFYPLRSAAGRSLVSSLLSTEQNITGIWSKACALHRVAAEGTGIERELAVSYLFSNNQILQEESARAIRAINREWYIDAETRLPGIARTRIEAVINGTVPEMAMIFEKTRFLSLCFSSIPEERMIMLAKAVRYSETYDAETLPGQISWIVPSQEGKSGLYSLPVSDITAFVFHYSEYTDIFVEYMNKQGNTTV